jgi:release factor glutamine methyltransferase
VLANLPYVSGEAAGRLGPEILDYEPRQALFAGRDGLDVIRRLTERLRGMTTGSVKLAGLEVAPEQASTVDALLCMAGFRSIEVRSDLAGHERVIVGRR